MCGIIPAQSICLIKGVSRPRDVYPHVVLPAAQCSEVLYNLGWGVTDAIHQVYSITTNQIG